MGKQASDQAGDQTGHGSLPAGNLRPLMEHIQDGYFEIDAQGQMCHANGVFLDLLNLDYEQLGSIHLADILSGDACKGRLLYDELTQRVSASQPFEFVLGVEGSPARRLMVTLMGRGNPPDPTTGFVGVVKDANSRKKMAAGLARTKSFLQSMINSCIEGVAAADSQGVLVYVSPRIVEMTGYSREELLGAPLVQLFRAGEYDVRLIERALREEGSLRDHETLLVTKEGDALDVSMSVSLLRDEGGATQGELIICRDVTESKRLEAQLRFGQRMEAIGTLAGGIAHNFNNLLMGIQGNTTLMLLDTDTDHANYKRILNIEKHIQSGSRLTRQLVGYAREGKYEVQSVDLNRIVRETGESFALTKASIQFEFHLDPKLPGVMADHGQIEQVLMNLLVNAVHAMPEGGQITIETQRISHSDLKDKPYQAVPGEYASMAVTDSGLGMDAETLRRVFEPFFTTKGLDRGNGLGLASCYGIIKAHGGYIDAASQPGEGSCFTIFLPGCQQPVSRECEESDQCYLGDETILVVDDETMILEVTREMLEQLGYRVLTAEGGIQAVNIYKEQGPAIDLVVLDMVMPEMGGDKTFEVLKGVNPQIKVLLASGFSMEGKAVVLLDQGCKGFIQKPFSLPALSLKIRDILDAKDNNLAN